MNAKQPIADDWDTFVEGLAAEFTTAAYPVVLQHGLGEKWLDVELDLWKAMTETVKRLAGAPSQSDSRPSKLPTPAAFFE